MTLNIITDNESYLGALWTRCWLIRFLFCSKMLFFKNYQNAIVLMNRVIFWLDLFLSYMFSCKGHLLEHFNLLPLVSSCPCVSTSTSWFLCPPCYLLPPSPFLYFALSISFSLALSLSDSLLLHVFFSPQVFRCKPNTLITALAEIDVTRFKFSPAL